MNSFGRFFRISIFGESHGDALGVVIDGCPAGLPLKKQDFSRDLERRKPKKRAGTPRREKDDPMIESGVFNHKTTGAPIAIRFANENIKSDDYLPCRTLPRPGHADFVAFHKFGGFQDPGGGGHFSGRLTLTLVASGVIAKKMVAPAEIKARILEIGGSTDYQNILEAATEKNDSVGGVVECQIKNLPVGLGEPFFDSAESLISHMVFSIPGIKGIEFGSGFACSRMRGSECNDIFIDKSGKTRTNHAGGINGGITNGNDVVFRVAVKPTPSIGLPQETIDLQTGEKKNIAIKGRHDICFALRMPVIVESAAAVVFADLMQKAQNIPGIWGGKR